MLPPPKHKPPVDLPTPPAPDDAALHAAALAHLARYATTRAGLLRVLDRRIDRWARAAVAAGPDEAARQARRTAREVVARLATAGLLDDAAFAATRARRLVQSGRSRRAVAAHLAAHGVVGADTEAALASPAIDGGIDSELAAALVLARRRRIGPFRAMAADPEAGRKELGIMARAGFPREVASRALRMSADEAEALIIRLRCA